jgi:hypothetical protein
LLAKVFILKVEPGTEQSEMLSKAPLSRRAACLGLAAAAGHACLPNNEAIAQEDPWTWAAILEAAGKGIIAAAAGTGFLKIIGADDPTIIGQRVEEIIAAAIQELEKYIHNALIENDLLLAKGKLSGTAALLQEYHETESLTTLDRASQEATLLIYELQAIGSGGIFVYPVAYTLKLAMYVAYWQRKKQETYYNLFTELATNGKVGYDHKLREFTSQHVADQVAAVSEIQFDTSLGYLQCRTSFRDGSTEHIVPWGSREGRFTAPSRELWKKYGEIAECPEFQEAVRQRNTIIDRYRVDGEKHFEQYTSKMDHLFDDWVTAACQCFGKPKLTVLKKMASFVH